MESIAELLHARFLKIDDILQYIVPDKPGDTQKQVHEISGLEEITLCYGKKDKVTKKFEKISLENSVMETRKNNEKPVTNVMYKLFIPAEGLERYDNIDMRYSVDKDNESVEINLKEEEEKACLRLQTKKKEKIPYSITFSYDREKKGYKVEYEGQYTERIDNARQDFTNRLDKALEILPKSLMGGVLGFTYLGSGKMARRDDLFGKMALLVDVHEAIHTPDEYETRVLTGWILLKEKPKYKH